MTTLAGMKAACQSLERRRLRGARALSDADVEWLLKETSAKRRQYD